MNIIIVNKFLYAKGGDAISALDTGALLKQKGHTVNYWGMDHRLNGGYKYKDLFMPQADFDKPGHIFKQIKLAGSILYSLDAKSKIESLIELERPDVLHLNNIYHQISPSIIDAISHYKIPMVMTFHDFKMVCASYSLFADNKPCELCKNGRYYHCFFKKCFKDSFAKSLLVMLEMYLHQNILHIYNKIDAFISPSKFLIDKMHEMGFKRNIIHLPNFIELNCFKPQYTATGNTIVYFGRISAEKGLSTLIKAAKNCDNVSFRIIGDGPSRNNLEHEAISNGVTNISFLGYKTGDDLKDEIRNSLFTILPSECYENNPRSIIESFALGKPVVASRIGGIPELVRDNKTGLTFTAGSSDDLAEKIRYLTYNTNRIIEMGKTARHFVENEMNADQYYAKLTDIYAGLSRIKR